MSDRLQKHRKSNSIALMPQAAELSLAVQPKTASVATVAPPVLNQSVAPTEAVPQADDAAEEKIQSPLYGFPGYSLSRITIQPKLTVSPPDDPTEREADQVAAQVMRMPQPASPDKPLPRQLPAHSFRHISVRAPDSENPPELPTAQVEVQRRCAVCEAETVMRQENGDGIGDVSHLGSKLAASQGRGISLPEDVRSFMEPRFGFDFSQVRVHTDSTAVQMNQELKAQAFTHGNNIYFNSGQYSPGSREGQELLAHELTHTVQQTGGKTLGNTKDDPNRSLSEDGIQQEKDIQEDKFASKSIAKAPFPVISLKASSGSGTIAPATPPPAPQIDTSSAEGLLQSLATTPASSLSPAVNQAKGATAQIQAQEKQALEQNLPEQESSTGLPRQPSRPQAKATVLTPGEAPTFKVANVRPEQAVSTQHQAARGAVPGSGVSTQASAPPNPGSLLGWLTGRVGSFLKDLPTKDPELNTSAGDRPKVALEGEADPNQSNQFHRESEQEVKARQRRADQAAAEDFGDNDIYPTVSVERLRSSYKLSAPGGVEGRGKNPPHLPEDVRAAFDQRETPKLTPKLQYQLGQYQAKEAKHQQESQQIRQEGRNRIDRETIRVRDQQTGFQQQAQSDVNGERQRWREENQRIQEEYSNQSQAKRRELDQQIQGEVDTTERETDKRLSEAERKAKFEREKTEREAENKKREAENQPQSFWERAKDSISAVFDGIRQVISSLFESLRQLVRQIIEAAKTAVKALIEAARRVIVGLIRGFGEVLKGLVTVALFAFPDMAARAREWIDGRVNTAIDRVNEAAEQLKQFTDEALDWIGQRLDQALNLLQGTFNFALDALETLALAPLEMMDQLAQIMDWLRENQGFVQAVQNLEQRAAEIEAAAKEKLQGYVDQIPDEVQRLIDEAQQKVDSEALKEHLAGIWHYLKQDFNNLKNGWWGAVKDMVWTWIWPFHANSPVQKDWPTFTQELGNCLTHVSTGEYGKAIDSFLKASQLLTGIIDAFSAWFTLAAVIVGAVIGAAFFGVGAVAGAKVGLEVAGALGTGLAVFSVVIEAGMLGKAIYDLSTGENTPAEDDTDYQAIASSGMALGTEAIFSLLGFAIGAAATSSIGTKIGHSIGNAIVRMLRSIPYTPKPGRLDLPDVDPTPGGAGDRPGGTPGETPETPGRADEPTAPETPGRRPEEPATPEEPRTPEPDTTAPAQTRDRSTGDEAEPATPDTTHPAGDGTQSPRSEADTRSGDQPSPEADKPGSDRNLTEEQLAKGLPPDLQGQVPVRINPELSGNTVRVYYSKNWDGTVGDIHIEAGPGARRVDIELHANTVRLMQRYSGLSGQIRILKERIENWIRRNGEPPVGTKAWEAKFEIEKLPRIIDERLDRLSRGNLDAQAEAEIRADIENLERQLAQHQRTLDEMDADSGAGFVAAEGGTPRQRKFETEIQGMLNNGTIDEEMAGKLRRYNELNPSGERTVANAKEQFESGKTLTEGGGFIEPDKKPDFVPTIEKEPSLPHSKLSPDTQKRLKEIETERASARNDREQAKKEHGEDSQEYKDAQQRVVTKSEALGETAAESVVEHLFPGAKRLKSSTPGGKQGEFDLVYEHNGEIIIVEAKGGGARRGSRRTQTGRAEQGTSEYRRDITQHMLNEAQRTNDRDLLQTARKIDRAANNGKLRYFQMSQGVDDSGNLVPEVSIERFTGSIRNVD